MRSGQSFRLLRKYQAWLSPVSKKILLSAYVRMLCLCVLVFLSPAEAMPTEQGVARSLPAGAWPRTTL
jgi:hypothetical protein